MVKRTLQFDESCSPERHSLSVCLGIPVKSVGISLYHNTVLAVFRMHTDLQIASSFLNYLLSSPLEGQVSSASNTPVRFFFVLDF